MTHAIVSLDHQAYGIVKYQQTCRSVFGLDTMLPVEAKQLSLGFDGAQFFSAHIAIK